MRIKVKCTNIKSDETSDVVTFAAANDDTNKAWAGDAAQSAALTVKLFTARGEFSTGAHYYIDTSPAPAPVQVKAAEKAVAK